MLVFYLVRIIHKLYIKLVLAHTMQKIKVRIAEGYMEVKLQIQWICTGRLFIQEPLTRLIVKSSKKQKKLEQLKGIKTSPIQKSTSAKPTKKRGKSAAERRALSEKMKQVWAARRSKAKSAKPAKTKAKAGTKVRPKTAAEKKALSLKMKEVWKKRKAATPAAQKA